MPRVFIADKLEASGSDLLRQAGLEVDHRTGLAGKDLLEAVRAADGVIVRSATKMTAEVLEEPGRCRAIVRAGVGVDNIDVAAATRKGVVVMNTPGGNTISAAEHTIALLFALVRQIPKADASMRSGKWERGKFLGMQLAGKTLGLIGLGRIGREVARRALGLDMKVIGFDPFLTSERAAQLGIEAVNDLDPLLPRCDVLSFHTPLTDETHGLIGERELKRLPNSACLLNVARGGIVDEAALVQALRDGHIAGAALDVYAQEPLPADSPLLQAPNLVLTPHLGASTIEAQDAVAREAAQLLTDFLQRGIVTFAINMAAVDRTELDELRQYIDLAHRLGLLQAQLAHGPISRAELHYRGALSHRKYRLLTAAFTAGLLEAHLSEQVNIVNAELLARERGIEISETVNPKEGDFANLVQTIVHSSEQAGRLAAGTLFGNQYVRLVQLDDFRLESFLDGTLMLFTHRDAPGLIGFMGNILGKHQVNIASMSLGRKLAEPGGEAVAILNLDSDPPADALAEIQTHPEIFQVSVVRLPKAGAMPMWFG